MSTAAWPSFHAGLGPQALAETRERFAQGGVLPAGLLSAPLQRSWERTRAAGLRPRDQALFHHQVSEPQRRRVHEAHRPLIALAAYDMAHLLRTMNSPNWVVLLTNTQGTIVHSLGDHVLAPRRLQLPLGCGRSLLEGEIGSNAPIIAGQEAQDVLLSGVDHYLDELRAFTCAAAPVFGVDGRVAAVLDVTGVDVSADALTLARVRRAARSIEGRLFEQHGEGWVIRLHEDARFIGTPEQGLLLVREDGRLLGANLFARRMLGLEPLQEAHTLPALETLFEARSLATLRRQGTLDAEQAAHHRGACPVQTQAGALLHATLQWRGAVPVQGWRGQAVASSQAVRPARRVEEIASAEAVKQRDAACPAHGDPVWHAAFERAGRVYPHGVAVLIQGETGTGKEWFARALHEAHRPGRPFVAVNCAALAESMAEAELFGHVEGAFTGARKGGAAGRLEQADGGTLFLDEIGDMPAHLQTRLLRVLQERRVLRIGGNRETPLDLLVLSASHRDLQALVASGAFRQDLYYRLNGLTVSLPALRERTDIDALIVQCLGDTGVELPPALHAQLRTYPWPGNLRQMAQALRVAALLAGAEGVIAPDMLPPEVRAHAGLLAQPALPVPQAPASHEVAPVVAVPGALTDMQAVQQQAVRQALAAHGGNVSAAARALGVSRTTFYKHLGASH